ncbi:MAG: cysteine desulfurase-like protein [Acidobacteriota bacterium]
MQLDVEFVRRHFPALADDWVLMDNAGGSIMPSQVSDLAHDYMRRFQVQLGASYGLSTEAGERVAAGRRAMAAFIGADEDEVILGPSTTLNLELLAGALADLFEPGDELVVTNLDHEANVGPWRRLAESLGVAVREWRIRSEAAALEVEDLEALLSPRTRLVCLTHCSNLAGQIVDVAAVARRVHQAGAKVCVDGVAFAPHRRVDVKALGVDIYALSLYKTYGPHLGLLYVQHDLLQRAANRNHFFVDTASVDTGSAPTGKLHLKLEPGNVSYELAAALPGILDYFDALATHHLGASAATEEAVERLERVFQLIAEHEERLASTVLDYLRGNTRVRIIGPETADRGKRVPTISFVVEGRPSSSVPPRLDPHRVAIRYGHFYAYRPIRDLGLLDGDGVVRVSLVHYNTEAEVDRLLELLDRAISD